MTGVEATYLYRREVARAISRYSASIKQIFETHGSPIPPSPECAGAMGNAWGTCRVDFYKADQKLEADRRFIAADRAQRDAIVDFEAMRLSRH